MLFCGFLNFTRSYVNRVAIEKYQDKISMESTLTSLNSSKYPSYLNT